MLSYFFIILSSFYGPNIRIALKMLFLLSSQNLKFFSKTLLKIFRYLLIIFGVSLKKTCNTNQKKFKIRYYIFNVLNLFY